MFLRIYIFIEDFTDVKIHRCPFWFSFQILLTTKPKTQIADIKSAVESTTVEIVYLYNSSRKRFSKDIITRSFYLPWIF